jgi:adenosylhomocysteine nucleosidase
MTVGVISALPEEIRRLGDHLEGEDKIARGGYSFRIGRIDGIPVTLVEAGIGKVNTALVATLLFDHFRCRSVLFTGVAGGIDPDLRIGDVVVGDRLIQHDYGAIVRAKLRNFRPGALPYGDVREDPVYPLDANLAEQLRQRLTGVELPLLPAAATGEEARRPSLTFGTIVSGDQFINCEDTRRRLFSEFGAQAVEMEGAALAQVAQQFGASAVTVRCLSDLAGAESYMDFMAFLSSASEIAAAVLRRILPVM